jgi:hypothetical protein
MNRQIFVSSLNEREQEMVNTYNVLSRLDVMNDLRRLTLGPGRYETSDEWEISVLNHYPNVVLVSSTGAPTSSEPAPEAPTEISEAEIEAALTAILEKFKENE